MLAIYHLERIQANGIIITINCDYLWVVLNVSSPQLLSYLGNSKFKTKSQSQGTFLLK